MYICNTDIFVLTVELSILLSYITFIIIQYTLYMSVYLYIIALNGCALLIIVSFYASLFIMTFFNKLIIIFITYDNMHIYM